MKGKIAASIAILLVFAIRAFAQESPQLFHQPTEAELKAAQERAQAELSEAKATYQVALDSLTKSQQDLRALTHRLDVSPEALQKAAAHLDEQLETLELDEVGSAARRKATEAAIKQEMDRVEKHANDDPVAAELQNVVKAREAQLQRLREMFKAAVVSQAEVEATAASIAEAKAKLAERQQSAVGGIDGESVASLRRDLLNLSIVEQERQARMQYLKMQQQRLSQAMDSLAGIQERKYDVDRARARVERAQDWAERLQRGGGFGTP